MPYQIIKYENIAKLKHTPRVSWTAIFVRFTLVVSAVYVHIIVDNSTEQLCGKQQARKKETFIKLFRL